jgi:hypothetical protein
MVALLRAGCVWLGLAVLLASGCGPTGSTPGGTPPAGKPPTTNGKPIQAPKPDRG